MEGDRERCREPQPAEGEPWPWATLVAAVPLLVALLTLQLIGPEATPHAAATLDTLKQASQGQVFLPGAVTYAAAVTCHIVLCLGAIAFYGWIVAQATPTIRRRALVVGGAMLLVVLPGLLVVGDERFTAFRLSYYNYEDLFSYTPAGGYLLAPSGIGLSLLSVAAILPTAFGILAVIAAAGAGHALVEALPSTREPGWQQRLRRARDNMRLAFYLLTAVLVTSTLSASLFFHLPIGLLAEGPEGRLASYAGELSIFWGTVFTLTLVATITPPLLHARQHFAAIVEGVADRGEEEETRKWLSQESMLDTLGQKMRLVLALLAPLITGPVASFLQAWQSG
jgi:hypothetical protein